MKCAVDDCERDAWSRGWCNTHYKRWYNRKGDTSQITERLSSRSSGSFISTPVIPRLFARMSVTESGCWEWNGFRRHTGHGTISVDGHVRFTHRVAYEFFIGPIPQCLVLDHVCMNPPCFNPDHLQPVTLAINTMRGESPFARNARKTHCIRGHEFTPENTIRTKRQRICRICVNRLHREYRARQKAKP